MNQKRAVIEQFIEKDLLDAVAVELSSGALAQESSLAQQLEEVTEMIRDNFGADARDAEGNLIKYADPPRGQQYLELREKVSNAKTSPELGSDIFNHLYAFFSRYYDEGDFMSLRRYFKRDKYATQTMFQLEDYVLSYMLDFETKPSETLLNVAKLDAPFDYKLRRHGKDEPLPVDLNTDSFIEGARSLDPVFKRRMFNEE